MKRMVSCVCVFVFVMIACVGFLSIQANADFTYTLNADGESYTVTDLYLNWNHGDSLYIPASYDGKPVTGIGKNAISGYSGLSYIYIPSSVTSIGNGAFSGCSGLTTISIPNSVTSIGDSAFYGCSGLTRISMSSVTTSIGSYAFKGCSSLKSITIPKGVTSIGEGIFSGCDGLTSISVASGNTTYYSEGNCLIRTATKRLIAGCPNSVIPNDVTSIYYSAFADYKSLKNIRIPNGVTEIAVCAFSGCSNLEEIEIPVSVTRIYYAAFKECTSLKTVNYMGVIEQWNQISIDAESNDTFLAAELRYKCQTGHQIKQATCTTPRHCKVCGYVFSEALGHTWKTNSDGSKVCTVCSHVEGDAHPEYTITYHMDGGKNAIKNPDVYTAEDMITLQDPVKTGYHFEGWFLDSDKTDRVLVISGKGDVDVYAKFTPIGYRATFQHGVILTVQVDGYETKQYYMPYGTTVDPYSKEFMSDYLSSDQNSEYASADPCFSGWYAVMGGTTTKLSGAFTMTADTKIYCDFGLTNRYDLPSGVSSNDVVSMFSGTSKSTFVVQGYNTKYVRVPTLSTGEFYIQCFVTLGGSSGSGSMVVYNLTKDREVVAKLSVEYGELYSTYSGTRKLYKADPGDILAIDGYSTTVKVSFDTPVRASSTMTASKITTKTIFYDQSIITPTPTNRNGYNFLGWYDANKNKANGTWKYLEDQIFTPMWQTKKYYITYNLQGGENSPSNPTAYTVEDTITLMDPNKRGYTFKGWYLDSNFKTRITSISEKTGNITLYAKWTVNSYNLTLDANEGTFAPKVTFISDGTVLKSCYLNEEDSITAYRPANKEGYIFAGWYKDEAFTTLFKFTGNITNDTKLYAKWVECDSNTVNIESAGNLNVTIKGKTEQLYAFVPLADGKITVTSESADLDLYGILYDASKNILVSADDISSSDLDFSYEYSVKAGQLYYIAVKGNTGSTSGAATVRVVWTGDCTVTGSTYSSKQVSVVYDTNYALPQKPTREGYVFLGWYDDSDTRITDGVWKFVTDKTLTAKWEVATPHTIVFKNEAGEIISSEIYYLGDNITAPELPTKAPDNTYTYSAKWDNDYTGVCVGDAVYTVVYEKTYIDYTIVFVDEDGTVISTKTYHYGDAVSAPADPTKAADKTYTYTFAGWDKAVVNCAGDATYTATYNSAYINYTVVFKNWDGSVISTKTYHYGDAVTAPANPTRAADKTYTYTFAGWDKTVVNCAGDATYTATYTQTYIEYTVKFVDWDGRVISSKTYHYGDAVSAPADPSRAADNTYTYTFKGWDKTVVSCASDATYTATYTQTYIEHTVKFVDWNGSVISTKTYHYGDKVTAPANPSRAADKTYTYTFAGWDKVVVTCTGDATCTATYTQTYINYTVKFVNWDGSVISTKIYHYGDAVTAPANPTRPADSTYTYTFAGWDKTVVNCAGNATYTATYRTNGIDYTVVFKDWDGSIISSKIYRYGDAVSAPANPARAADKTYTYTFKGWDKTVVNCAGSATYTATYTQTYIEYTVKFVDWNGSVISTKTYHYGDKVTVPANPTRAADKTYTYTFKGWDKTVVNCAGSATYTATYTQTYIEYTVKFVNNGTVISTKTYHYGDVVTAPANPTRAADSTYTYTFARWYPTVVKCAGNATYAATYTPTYIDYTVVFKNWDGSVISTKTYHYGDTVVAPADPTRTADDTYTYTFKGWDKTVVNCTGNATYSATYTPNYINYTIKFVNWDGTMISSKTYHYGDKVTVPGNPSRAEDETYTYTFVGWTPAVVNCAGNATYTATYTGQKKLEFLYTVKEGQVTITGYVGNGGAVEIPDTIEGLPVTAIGDSAFYECDSITSILVPDSVITIGSGAFKCCWQLANVQLSKNLTTLGESAFMECYSLTSIVIPEGVTQIGLGMFYCCSKLTEITIPSSVTSIGYFAFANSGLCDVYYTGSPSQWCKIELHPDGIGKTAGRVHILDENGQELTEITLDNTVTTIPEQAFFYCTSLTKITIPGSVESIGQFAFFGCTNLTDVWFMGSAADKASIVIGEGNDLLLNATWRYDICTVVFKSWDGTVISSKTYHHGDEVTVPADPIRADDETYTYIFTGWTPTVVKCSGDATYTATYSREEICRIPSTITSTVYDVQDGKISAINAGTTVETLLSGIEEGEFCTVYADGELVAADKLVGTGMVIKIMDGEETKIELAVVVAGDVNGDGKISVTDLLAVKSQLLKKSELEGAAVEAADVTADSKISITDFLQFKNHLLGKEQITPQKPVVTETVQEPAQNANYEIVTIPVRELTTKEIAAPVSKEEVL